ncbi:MAG: DUF4180 domain-containing protein [Gemmatimonas sp.]|nr:DUF4180 domain-containing protein [Gemmatimonas sp.]
MVVPYFEPASDEGLDPSVVTTPCIESGASSILLDEDVLPAEFFDLSTRLAGELLHRLSIYGIRLAGVVPRPESHSPAFQAFVREANRGDQFRFFSSRSEAVDWLVSRSDS